MKEELKRILLELNNLSCNSSKLDEAYFKLSSLAERALKIARPEEPIKGNRIRMYGTQLDAISINCRDGRRILSCKYFEEAKKTLVGILTESINWNLG